MGTRKREYIETTLQSLAEKRGKVEVLEWGSGGSTAYFTRFLRAHDIPYTWTSLEYDPNWFKEVSREIADDPDTEIVLFDMEGKNPRRRDVPMDEYVEYPRTLGKQFDLIIVDGRKRRRCVEAAHTLLSKEGVVLLDDAFRPYYWCAFKDYPDSQFLWSSFWKGGVQEMRFTVRLAQMLFNTAWKVINRYAYTRRRIQRRLMK